MIHRRPGQRLYELESIWLNLTIDERQTWLGEARQARFNRNFRPVSFSLHAALFSFALLVLLPVHPVSIFVAFGCGLSLALIFKVR